MLNSLNSINVNLKRDEIDWILEKIDWYSNFENRKEIIFISPLFSPSQEINDSLFILNKNLNRFEKTIQISKQFYNLRNFLFSYSNFSAATADYEILKKILLNKFVLVDEKINYREIISNIIFSFIMALVITLVLSNFYKRKI